MKIDSANRAFLALVAVGVAAYVVAGLGACAVFSLVAYRVSVDGLGVLSTGGPSLLFALLFLAVTGAGTLLGLWSLRNQLKATQKLADAVRARLIPTPPEVRSAAERAGLGRRVDVVDGAESFSFTYGLFFSRVVVSRGLLDALAPGELDAVLEHERYHVQNFDPLKVLLARALPAAFFYLPLLRDFRRRYVAGRELAADRRAVRTCGRSSLAGALYKVVRGPAWADLGGAAAIGGPELLDIRVSQLETGSEPAVAGVSPVALALSAAGLGILLASMGVALAGAGGPFALMRRAMPSQAPVMAVGMALCAAFLAWVGWRMAHWAWRRHSRFGLDTTRA